MYFTHVFGISAPYTLLLYTISVLCFRSHAHRVLSAPSMRVSLLYSYIRSSLFHPLYQALMYITPQWIQLYAHVESCNILCIHMYWLLFLATCWLAQLPHFVGRLQACSQRCHIYLIVVNVVHNVITSVYTKFRVSIYLFFAHTRLGISLMYDIPIYLCTYSWLVLRLLCTDSFSCLLYLLKYI